VALFEDILNGGNLVTGIAIGAGALVAWPLVSPLVRLLALAKSLLKGGLIAYREAERVYADAVEAIGHMVQEAQHEMVAPTPARGNAKGSSPRAT
jgi:hypothetical protein